MKLHYSSDRYYQQKFKDVYFISSFGVHKITVEADSKAWPHPVVQRANLGAGLGYFAEVEPRVESVFGFQVAVEVDLHRLLDGLHWDLLGRNLPRLGAWLRARRILRWAGTRIFCGSCRKPT